ncbi:hypothetical protein NA78x_000082 [Anatilimnocola sp. NA78]|uniref:hypothetical protein n=1 Tax=Anatilimnocola sp. NA78 TaxID=3415683 RepID=UPI003CE56DF9
MEPNPYESPLETNEDKGLIRDLLPKTAIFPARKQKTSGCTIAIVIGVLLLLFVPTVRTLQVKYLHSRSRPPAEPEFDNRLRPSSETTSPEKRTDEADSAPQKQ